MSKNWQYKLCISPLLLIFSLWAILNLWGLWYSLKVDWFILTNPKLWFVSIFNWKLWLFETFVFVPFFAAFFAVTKLWEVWDEKYFEKKLWITLGIIFSIPIIIILANIISKWAVRGFFISVGYSL